MFGKKNRCTPPDTPFVHADDCKIVAADPGVEPPVERDRARSVGAPLCAAASIGASQPLAASGSIRSIRRPNATWERASTRASLNPT